MITSVRGAEPVPNHIDTACYYSHVVFNYRSEEDESEGEEQEEEEQEDVAKPQVYTPSFT